MATPKKKTPAKKAARKTAAKATTPAKEATEDKGRGAVLKPMSIKDILQYIGGDENTVIAVSKKSLVDAKTKNTRAEALAALEDDDDLA